MRQQQLLLLLLLLLNCACPLCVVGLQHQWLAAVVPPQHLAAADQQPSAAEHRLDASRLLHTEHTAAVQLLALLHTEQTSAPCWQWHQLAAAGCCNSCCYTCTQQALLLHDKHVLDKY
jgi:hypothetical protein